MERPVEVARDTEVGPTEPERQDAFVARLSPRRLYELAGEDFRLCLDMAGKPPGRLGPLDFVAAAVHLLPPLGISGAAWGEAAETMGDLRAALCVLITDANRDHPLTPIRKPGGHLRALTQRHRASSTSWAASSGSRSGGTRRDCLPSRAVGGPRGLPQRRKRKAEGHGILVPAPSTLEPDLPRVTRA